MEYYFNIIYLFIEQNNQIESNKWLEECKKNVKNRSTKWDWLLIYAYYVW